MQTSINVKQALGLVGEVYQLTPWVVDARQMNTTVSFGNPIGVAANGSFGAMDATTYTTFAGIAVRPHEHVSYGTSNSPLAATISVPAGEVVSVLSKGRIIINFDNQNTLAVGDKIYVTAAGTYTTAVTTSNVANTLVGTVVVGIDEAKTPGGSEPIAIEVG